MHSHSYVKACGVSIRKESLALKAAAFFPLCFARLESSKIGSYVKASERCLARQYDVVKQLYTLR